MKLSEMRQTLTERGIRLTKSLGQNFLHDANQVRRIVNAAELNKQDKVLEIGPGLGPLTELLLSRAGEVLAIEKDARLVEFLRDRFNVAQASRLHLAKEPKQAGETPALHLLHDDALEFLRRELRDWSEWKLVSNLPYSVASPILVELARGTRSPQRIVATLQIEVARRLMAKAGDEDSGLLTLLVQVDFEPSESFRIPASCFFPEPDVDSACIVLQRRTRPLVTQEQRAVFVDLVKRSFSQRRKMMLKLLKSAWPEEKLERAFAELGLSQKVRAEEVTLEQFARLTGLLNHRPRLH